MKQGEVPQTNDVCCATCSKTVPSYDSVNYGSIEKGYRHLCGQCFNREVAILDGLDKFDHINFAPVSVADSTGELHEFHFRVRLFGTGVALDAFELHDRQPAGYQFQIIGDPEDDLLALLGRLIERIRRALSVKYLQDSNVGPQIANRAVCGRIEWDDPHDGRLPLVIVDGRKVSWDDFGRMLMSFEGFQFRLNIHDKSEEC
jgi:hypothetical protein